MKASVNFVGNTSMVVGIRVEAEHIQTGVVKHCNSSFFTMVAKNDEGKSVEVPGLILTQDIEVKRFLKAIKRSKNKRTRQREFEGENFNSENYLHLFKDHKVEIKMP
jgi:acyl-CoA hydrolase